MQLSLFGSHHIKQNDFHLHLREFELEKAIKDLHSLKHTFDPPENLEAKMEAIEALLDSLDLTEDELIIHLAWLRKEYKQVEYLQALETYLPSLLQGINRKLYELLDKSAFDFIYEDTHPAEIFILQNDFSHALKSLESFFYTYGENAFLRELHGFVLWKTKHQRESYYDFTFALFDDATKCSLNYLLPKNYQRKFEYFLAKFGDENKAWAHLPFSLWQDGQTYIDPENKRFELHLKEKLNYFTVDVQDAVEILRQFNTLLYLAEVIRLRNAPNASGPELEELQQRMRDLSLEYYGIYYETLKAFRNIP